MALGTRLDLRQSQQLVLTPQLQQAIKLLQYTNLELSDYIVQEIEKNPLLETADPSADNGPGPDSEGSGDAGWEAPTETVDASGADDGGGIVSADQGLADGSGSEGDAPLDADYSDNVYNNDATPDTPQPVGLGSNGPVGGADNLDLSDIGDTLTRDITLKDHLSNQMPMAVASLEDRMIAAHLIDLVDEAGYLRADISDLHERLGCTADDVARVLQALQRLDPAGCFARDLKECLKLQLIDLNRYDPYMEKLLANLHLLAQNDRNGLKKVCGVTNEDMADMLADLRRLDPKPGLAFGGEENPPIVPDIFVRKGNDGLWVVELNNEALPKVLVNQSYYAELNTKTNGKDDKSFLSECLADANWLVRALDQRQRTIIKVASELVRRQEGFFNHGVRHLKPLILRDIAEAIDMHESTVSRVTSNKYMATARGVFELKYFFTTALKGSDGDGESHSSEAVRDRIRELIDNEMPNKVLSDDKIVTILRGEGIDIARRTVAKYRESMRISSSVERRRQKSMSL